MLYSLNDFLGSDIIPEIYSLTAPMNYTNRPVQAACVQELLIEGFAREGDLMLITAMECESIPNGYSIVIRRAVNAHAAAILFSLTDNDKGVPEDMLAYANKNGMPLFAIPYKYHYSNIIEQVSEAIKNKELDVYANLQNDLFNYFFESRTLEDAIRLIASRLQASVTLFSDMNVPMIEKDREENIPRKNPAQFDGNRIESKCPISAGSVTFGTLVVSSVDNPLVLRLTREIMVHYFAIPLSLWFNRQSIEDMTKARIRGDFVQNLATGRYSSRSEMVRIGQRLHFDLSLPYACVIMTVQILDEQLPFKEYSVEFANNISIIEQLFLNTGKSLNRQIMVYNTASSFVAFLETQSDSRAEVEAFISILNRQIAGMFPPYRCLWGVSDLIDNPVDFQTLYRNARLALRFCINSGGKIEQFFYRDVTQALIVSILSDDDRIQKEIEKIILPLVEYHESSGINLFGTLVEYIKNHCNKNQTALALHIHRQSLPYRLEKIEELTGLSLDNHSDLFVLETLSRIYQPF